MISDQFTERSLEEIRNIWLLPTAKKGLTLLTKPDQTKKLFTIEVNCTYTEDKKEKRQSL
jgi:hypothetical protein